jgi:glycosyltransferase involved in cell wall biosynthesis
VNLHSWIPPSERPSLRVHALVDNLLSGGAEFLLAEFAQVAGSAGIDLSVAALKGITPPSPAADRLRRRGLQPQAVPVTRMVDPRDLRRVRAHLSRVRPDLVHTHLGTSDFLGGIGARSLGLPAVATIHADWWPDGPSDRVRMWLMATARRRCADIVVAVSESARTEYLRQRRDQPEHVIVVHNGISDRAAPGSGTRVRAQLGIRQDEFVVLALSKLRPEKNLEGSIDAVATLADRFGGVRLVIAGDGPHEDAVRRHASALGSRVVLAGHREDVMDLLDASDVLIHPSHFDAFPTSVLEAMAASVPVVTTATGGMLEMIEDGVEGILVPPPPTAEAFARALATVLERPELRARLAAGARARYDREFTGEAWAHRIRAVYDRVLSARRPSGRPFR